MACFSVSYASSFKMLPVVAVNVKEWDNYVERPVTSAGTKARGKVQGDDARRKHTGPLPPRPVT